MNKNIKILSLVLVGISQFSFSQIKEERLILDRKREPEVKKIEKKKTSVETEKNYPPKEKSQEPVEYKITNVPAVSDFKTSTIQGEDISPKFNNDSQRNYFQAGFGNYSKFLADANISYEIDDKTEVGVDLHGLTTNGLTKDFSWNSKRSDFNAAAFLNSFSDKGKLNITADWGNHNYNYYGIYALQPSSDIDLKQSYNQLKINGFYDFYNNDIFNNVKFKSSLLTDHFDARENLGSAELNLSKYDLPFFSAKDMKINADLGVNLSTQDSKFSLLNENQSNFLLTSLKPKISFYKGNSYLAIGSDFSFVNAKIWDKNTPEAKTNDFKWFPFAEVLFEATEQYKFYAGIDGGVQLNSYADLLQQNPYLVSDVMLKPTETKYHFYFGLKGDIDQELKYDVKAGFSDLKNAQFFRANDLFDYNNTLNRSAYNFANTFSAIYDDGTLSEVKGSLQYFPLQNLVIDAELHYMKFNLKNLNEVYYKPVLQSTFGAKYSLLDRKLNLGFKGIFVAERKTNAYQIDIDGVVPNQFTSTENAKKSLPAYLDLNLNTDYKINKNFTVFVMGNNLLNKKYEHYLGYKVLGAQVLGGIRIAF
ncbi:TonB-dependent receptor [Cloacibacterium sp.]|uniref:TonB-dependent receptor n=1 Tax=Cloacibacterium sp. TaxID=1913682 RepID=UPI0039E6392A